MYQMPRDPKASGRSRSFAVLSGTFEPCHSLDLQTCDPSNASCSRRVPTQNDVHKLRLECTLRDQDPSKYGSACRSTPAALTVDKRGLSKNHCWSFIQTKTEYISAQAPRKHGEFDYLTMAQRKSCCQQRKFKILRELAEASCKLRASARSCGQPLAHHGPLNVLSSDATTFAWPLVLHSNVKCKSS